jgi:hypothetical protein
MNMYHNIVECKIKCPKCRSKDIYLEEIWKGHSIQWDVVDGKFDRDDGVLEPGDPWKVYGECKKCNHIWRIRNANQINDTY